MSITAVRSAPHLLIHALNSVSIPAWSQHPMPDSEQATTLPRTIVSIFTRIIYTADVPYQGTPLRYVVSKIVSMEPLVLRQGYRLKILLV